MHEGGGMIMSSSSNFQINQKAGGHAGHQGHYFRRNTSNQSAKNSAHGHKNQQQPHHSGTIAAGSSIHHNSSQKHSGGIASRQNSGHNSNHLSGTPSTQGHPNSGIHRPSAGQQVPHTQYQTKAKILQIGSQTSPKVSPKNIKELLKFWVGQNQQQTIGNQANQAQGQNTINQANPGYMTNQILSTNNQAKSLLNNRDSAH